MCVCVWVWERRGRQGWVVVLVLVVGGDRVAPCSSWSLIERECETLCGPRPTHKGEIDTAAGAMKIWKGGRREGGSGRHKKKNRQGTRSGPAEMWEEGRKREREFKVWRDGVLSSPCPSSSPESRIAHLVTLNSRCSYPGERSGRGHFSSFSLTIW